MWIKWLNTEFPGFYWLVCQRKEHEKLKCCCSGQTRFEWLWYLTCSLYFSLQRLHQLKVQAPCWSPSWYCFKPRETTYRKKTEAPRCWMEKSHIVYRDSRIPTYLFNYELLFEKPGNAATTGVQVRTHIFNPCTIIQANSQPLTCEEG